LTKVAQTGRVRRHAAPGALFLFGVGWQVIATLLLLTVASAPAAGKKPPTADAPASYVANPTTSAARGDGTPISIEEAVRSGSAPGAVTEGQLSTTSGVVTPLSSEGGARGNGCWYVETSRSRGLWVYHREMVMATTWCAVYGSYITYRRTNVVGRTSEVCWGRSTSRLKISGGAGYRWVKVHGAASFRCPLFDRLWLDVSYNVWGSYAIEESGG
jgi:hypothetical protein